MELEIEERVFGDTKDCLVPSSQIGQAKRLDDAVGRYIEYVKILFRAANVWTG